MEQLEQTKLITLIQIGNKEEVALYDTGSLYNLMVESKFNKIFRYAIPKLGNTNITLNSASLNKVETLGTFQATITIGSKNCITRFILCKKLSFPIIIGLDFMRCNKVLIDLKKNVLHLDEENVNFHTKSIKWYLDNKVTPLLYSQSTFCWDYINTIFEMTDDCMEQSKTLNIKINKKVVSNQDMELIKQLLDKLE